MKRAEEDLLVIAAQKGSRKAFDALYRYHLKPLTHFAYRQCGDAQIALDAVQDAWITLSKSLRKLNDPRSFRSWIYKTVKWRVVDLLRKQRREVKAVEAAADEAANHDAFEGIDERNATDNQLSVGIAKLSEDEKQIITLFYLQEMKLIEIASILDVPIGTVKSRLSRARSRLRQYITGDENV